MTNAVWLVSGTRLTPNSDDSCLHNSEIACFVQSAEETLVRDGAVKKEKQQTASWDLGARTILSAFAAGLIRHILSESTNVAAVRDEPSVSSGSIVRCSCVAELCRLCDHGHSILAFVQEPARTRWVWSARAATYLADRA